VDQLLRQEAEARRVIREVHPEVCFWALASERPMKVNKKEASGFAERREVLKTVHPHADRIITDGLQFIQGKGVKPDDLLDALAAALTGLLGGSQLKTLPAAPERDAYGLSMEMVYFIPGN
jgi:predicted RNase H-like nuclease